MKLLQLNMLKNYLVNTMNKPYLTPLQARCVDAIWHYWYKNTICPSQYDLMQMLNLKHKRSIQQVLNRLRKKKLVDWLDGIPRTIHIVDAFKYGNKDVKTISEKIISGYQNSI